MRYEPCVVVSDGLLTFLLFFNMTFPTGRVCPLSVLAQQDWLRPQTSAGECLHTLGEKAA